MSKRLGNVATNWNPKRYNATSKKLDYERLLRDKISKLEATNLVLNQEILYLQAQISDLERRLKEARDA